MPSRWTGDEVVNVCWSFGEVLQLEGFEGSTFTLLLGHFNCIVSRFLEHRIALEDRDIANRLPALGLQFTPKYLVSTKPQLALLAVDHGVGEASYMS